MKRSLGSALVAVVLALLSVTSWAAEKAGEACVQASPTDMVVASVGQLGSEEVLLCTGGVWVSQGRVGTEVVLLGVTVQQDGDKDSAVKASLSTFDGAPVTFGKFQQVPYVQSATTTVTKDGVKHGIVPATLNTGVSFIALPKIQNDGRIEADFAVGITTLSAMKAFKSGDAEIQIPDTVTRNARQKVVFENGQEKTVFVEGGYAVKIRATIGRADK